jgi:hypothetical protein
MESRVVFLEALIAAATKELQLNMEEGNHPHTTFEMYAEPSDEPSPDLHATLITTTPKVKNFNQELGFEPGT